MNSATPVSMRGPGARAWIGGLAMLMAVSLSQAVWADKLPPLWGYGVKSCADFVAARKGQEQGVDAAMAEYRRYEDWLTGFVSGLNLATGQDVLRGAAIDGALRRIYVHCRDHVTDDFFTSTMDLVRMLSSLR